MVAKFELMPADLLLILRIAGLQSSDEIFVDPLLLNNVSQPELEQAFAGLIDRGLVTSSDVGGLRLAPDVAANAEAVLHPQASLAMTVRRSQDDARAMFVNFGPREVCANRITEGQIYRLESVRPHVDAVVGYLLAHLEASDTEYGVQCANSAGIDWTQLKDEPDVFDALLTVAARSGLIEAGQARNEMRDGTLVTLKASLPKLHSMSVETLQWVEKAGTRWLMRGVEGNPHMTLMRLNGPALRAVLMEVVRPMLRQEFTLQRSGHFDLDFTYPDVGEAETSSTIG